MIVVKIKNNKINGNNKLNIIFKRLAKSKTIRKLPKTKNLKKFQLLNFNISDKKDDLSYNFI